MWTLCYCIKCNRNQGKRNITLPRAGGRGFWTWHWKNPIVSGIKCLDLGEWNLLGETAEFFRWPAPGRQANVSFPSGVRWVLLPLRDPSSGSAPGCLLSCLSGSLYAVHGCLAEVTHSLLTECDEFHPDSPCWHPSSQCPGDTAE